MKEKPQTDAHLHGARPYWGSITFTSRFFNIGNEKRQQENRLREAQKTALRSPGDPRAHLFLAWHLAENNQLHEAVLAWTKGHLLLPFGADIDIEEEGAQAQMNAWAHDIWGDILLKSGATEQARAEWEKASALDKYGVGDEARRKLKEHSSSPALE